MASAQLVVVAQSQKIVVTTVPCLPGSRTDLRLDTARRLHPKSKISCLAPGNCCKRRDSSSLTNHAKI
jgi:hypothetical protein